MPRLAVSLLQATLASAAGGILAVDLDRRIVLFNRRFASHELRTPLTSLQLAPMSLERLEGTQRW